MIPFRRALRLLPVVPIALGLGACGASDRDDSSLAPLGVELAMAADSEAATTLASAPLIDLSPPELAARMAAGNVRLIDVRTDAEVAEGAIPGAEHIALDRFDPAKLDLSDGREVVLYCRSGRRSAIAGERLAAATGKPVEHLAGGIIAWEDAQQPIAPR
ncbi:MAG: rhodanese-like domain-containing protein [Alphaproteobacteria bacterium HGW-Alphaproteobacteria-7]|jgi:rhodanese-related sulfurtransferase|nr:MAG: rhodanese-like domain-containing protein [Alphaproteobacteria bacterium HGW-Alphaproteobacteria-7]